MDGRESEENQKKMILLFGVFTEILIASGADRETVCMNYCRVAFVAAAWREEKKE